MSNSPTQIKARIDEIDAILRSGASSVTLDGLTISYDFEELRGERKNLEKLLPGSKPRRKLAYRNNLGGGC